MILLRNAKIKLKNVWSNYDMKILKEDLRKIQLKDILNLEDIDNHRYNKD